MDLIMKKIVLIVLTIMIMNNLYSEQTVGLFFNNPQSYDGYTLFSPTASKTTYLIDNCGEKVHSWTSTTTPGNIAYLLDNGILLRTGRTYNPYFTAGGNGGLIQMLDWESNIIWEYYISDSIQCQHHDIEPLPNGNILALVWVSHTQDEIIQAGREIQMLELWSEKLIEIKPDLINGGGEVVWDWDSWDHYVQDYSEEKDNYGDVTNPRKINLNYSTLGLYSVDWLHFNSVDYNPRLDQIMLSNYNFGEVIIIDHSTTTAEARTDKGGKYGHGGDILYRWGNPMSYGQGTEDDIRLVTQHDPHWIPDSLPDGGKILVFNNKAGKNYSAIHIIEPELDEDGNYAFKNNRFGPTHPYWTYIDQPDSNFYSMHLSGSQRLPNGNTLICEGAKGKFTEINRDGQKVWQYVNPTKSNDNITNQGEVTTVNQVFRVERISKEHPALAEKELIPMGYLESGSDFTCELYDNQTSVDFDDIKDLFLNQSNDRIEIESKEIIRNIEIFNYIGVRILSIDSNTNIKSINTSNFGTGIYFLKIHSSNKAIHRKIMIN
jgi:arylsulfotransferase ASST/type IX secretion system substrate protein